jgi:hypothetical protein
LSTVSMCFIFPLWFSDTKAPWRGPEPAADQPKDGHYWHKPPGPSSVEITSYVILAYLGINQPGDARELVLFLQKNQNSIGGYSSTQVSSRCLLVSFSSLFDDQDAYFLSTKEKSLPCKMRTDKESIRGVLSNAYGFAVLLDLQKRQKWAENKKGQAGLLQHQRMMSLHILRSILHIVVKTMLL